MIDPRYTYYPEAVLNGDIVAGSYVKEACKRYLSFMEREDMVFRVDKVERIIHFVQVLTHGRNKNLHIDLQEWQLFILYAVFGFYYNGTNTRVTNNCYVEVARKNGKSTLISLIALYMMIGDEEYKSEVDIVANSHKQAKILYNMASDFCEGVDPKGKYFQRFRDNIQFPATKSFMQVLASDTRTLDGYNAYMFVQDEVHEAEDDKLYNVMKTSQASRENPLALLITTAGLNMDSFCYRHRQNCLDILYGMKKDDSQFALIYSLDEGDEYTNEEVWPKSNPNLGVSVREGYLRNQVTSAQNDTSLTTNIMTKNFNIWSQTYDVWIEDEYIMGAAEELRPEDFVGKQVYVGVDLAAVSDLTAVSMMTVEDGVHKFWNRYYIPSSVLTHSFNESKYREWYANGRIRVCPGNVTDYDVIVNDFVKWRDMGICIIGVYYDSWNSTQWAIQMTQQGFPLTPFSQSLGNFNRGTKEMERLLRQGYVKIDNNPINRWCFQNACLKVDYNNNCKPIKKGTENDKIDGVIAAVEALGGYLLTPQYSAVI